MSASQRRKGAAAEREFRDVLRAHGFHAERDGRLEADLAHNVPGVHFEVKRQERLDLPGWCRQCEAESNGRTPVVAYRRSREEWRVVVPASEYLRLKRLEADA